MVAAPERIALRGSQEARIKVVPTGEDHPRWDEIVEFIEDTGTELDPWQLEILRVSLMRRDDRWAAFAVAVCAPRQNGKNAILEMRELVGALVLGERLLIHTAHLADTSKEAFRRLDDLIDANEWLSRQVKHIWRTNGHESIEFRNGSRIRFRTRTRGGGRGFSGSPVIFDEAMFLPEVSMGAILPVISAQPDPQVWYMGSAVDQAIMDDGFVFARVRERALKGEDDRLAYFEWSAAVDSPEELSEDLLSDETAWAAANPAFGIRISADYIEEERRQLDDRTFAVERLGVGDWPSTDREATLIDMDVWDSLADPHSEIVGPVTFAFDVTPARTRGAIAAVGRRADGLPHLEIVDHRSGTGWMVDRIAQLAATHSPQAIVCDGASPAASLLPAFADLGIEVRTITSGELARACGLLFDLIEQRRIRHLGTSELRAAVRGVSQRPLGEAWAWSRRSSVVDISPLVAATVALWGEAALKPQMSSWGAV